MRISLLGPVEVRSETGDLVELGGARLRTLLIRLAVDPGRVVSRDALIDAVWGADAPENVVNALQQLVSRLRRVGLPIEGTSLGYRLDLPKGEIDIFAEGSRSWRGPALADVEDAAWAQPHLARLEELRVAAEEDRIEASLEQADVAEVEQLVSAHPLRERPVALLMRVLAHRDRSAEALAVYERFRELLADQLGTDPSQQLSQLHVSILRGGAERARPLRTALTSFVGRDEDLAGVRALLGQARLVTLVGPGGSGKTRLSVEIAQSIPDSIWVVELAPLTDPGEVAPATLASLGLREQALLGTRLSTQDAAQRLVGALAHRRALLVLDNCEHLVEEVAQLAGLLLGACPQVRILATSREPLGLLGEALWPVEPLSEASALQLLTDRAAAAAPGFHLDGQNHEQAVSLIRALDGMPLAIELAAARLRTMPLDQLVSRLDRRFRLLTGGSRTALPRHQTLRAVVDWSWDLLGEPERTVWRRLAVFSGGATLEAVEAVCGEEAFEPLTALVEKSLVRLDSGRYRMLETIREYGLDRLDEAGEREPAEQAHGDYFIALAERAEPFLRTGEQVHWLGILRADHDNLHVALRRSIARDDGTTAYTLLAMLGWYWWLAGHRSEGAILAGEVLRLETEAPAHIQALAFAMAALNILDGRGDLDQAKIWFEQASAATGQAGPVHPVLKLVLPTQMMTSWDIANVTSVMPAYLALFDDEDRWVAACARAFHGHALLNLGQDRQEAVEDFHAALHVFRQCQDAWGMTLALDALSLVAAQDGHWPESVAHAQEAIKVMAQLGTTEDLLQPMLRLVMAKWFVGDHSEALSTLAEAQQLSDAIGLPFLRAYVELAWSVVERQLGDRASARRRLAVADAILANADITAPQFQAWVCSAMGFLCGDEGDLRGARDAHTRALESALSSSDAPVIGAILVGCADLALREGDSTLCATLLGAADAMNGAKDHTVMDRPRIERAARESLGELSYAAAYRLGRGATVESVPRLSGLKLRLDPPGPLAVGASQTSARSLT